MAENESKSMDSAEVPAQLTILVVDDEKNMLRTLKISLSDFGYKVETASSGNIAVSMIRAGYSPDVILSDVMMPDGNGLTLKNWLETNRPGLVKRMIFMSASDETDLKGIIEEIAGKNSILEKPFNIDDLRKKIEELLSQNKIS